MSLIESIIAMSVLTLLIFIATDAAVHTLRVAALSGGRASSARTVSELAIRMAEEARSSTAVFIPANDVLGDANAGAAAHEVDFFRRLSAGGDSYVAYRLDAASSIVTRYEYTPAAGAATIVHADQLASGIAGFAPSRAPAGSMDDVVDAASVSDVSILYGAAGVAGGNDIVSLTVQAKSAAGITPAPVVVHLASRAAPTSLAILAPSKPPPAPGGPITMPFIIRGVKVTPPRGPWHSGDPGDPGDTGSSGIHMSLSGEVQFFGPGSAGLDWFELSAISPLVENGAYSYTNASGDPITVVFSCGAVPCPKFKPLPTSGTPAAPSGGVAFDAAP